jgi:hypothetical protein
MPKIRFDKRCFPIVAAVFVAIFLLPLASDAVIDGIEVNNGDTLAFTVLEDFISTPDGGSYLIWGYTDLTNPADPVSNHNKGRAQYPGPTIIMNEGYTLSIELTNGLTSVNENVSMIFPGQTGVTATGGVTGLLTSEAVPGGGAVTYTFTANKPGTYMYHSGSYMQRQIEMGLVGAIIVRPAMGPQYAYNHADTEFTHEYLFMLSEMDYRAHQEIEFAPPGATSQTLDSLYDNTDFFSVFWFINGRLAPDNMTGSFVPWLPTQPYNIMPRMHPGEKILMRVLNVGRELHPYHHHGNHAAIIAKDARLLSSNGDDPFPDPDLAKEVFTIQAVPGQTVDAIFEWTGQGLGWDIYGTPADDFPAHECIDNDGDGFADPGIPGNNPYEYCADHNKPFPTVLPEKQDLAFGGWYGGSPFMGAVGDLPPGEGGLNPNGGFSYMWHSHTEKELTNFDVFPGGMLTMLIIEPWGVDIP